MRKLGSALVLAGLLAAVPAAADLETAVALVRSQPGVLGAVPDGAGNLWVSVVANPQVDWNSYARLMCRMVVPQQARIFLVKIVDVNSTHRSRNPRNWKMIGGANCALP